MTKIRNPKFETRNKSEFLKSKTFETLGNSGLGVCFGFCASDFEFEKGSTSYV